MEIEYIPISERERKSVPSKYNIFPNCQEINGPIDGLKWRGEDNEIGFGLWYNREHVGAVRPNDFGKKRHKRPYLWYIERYYNDHYGPWGESKSLDEAMEAAEKAFLNSRNILIRGEN